MIWVMQNKMVINGKSSDADKLFTGKNEKIKHMKNCIIAKKNYRKQIGTSRRCWGENAKVTPSPPIFKIYKQ